MRTEFDKAREDFLSHIDSDNAVPREAIQGSLDAMANAFYQMSAGQRSEVRGEAKMVIDAAAQLGMKPRVLAATHRQADASAASSPACQMQ